MKTRQIIFNGVNDWEIRTVDLPPLKENEVLVKVEACGLCTWERDILSGREPADFPFTGGHEIAATVVEKGSNVDPDLKIGAKVAVAKWARCNNCYECRRGFDNHCREAQRPAPAGQAWGPGGFSEYLIAKSYEVFPLPGNNPVHFAALTEPMACVTRSIRRVDLVAGDTAVVIGAGFMGLLFLKLLKLRGIKVVVVQRSAKRRELAKQMGADLVVDPTSQNWVEVIKDFTEGRGAQSIFYTAGGPEMLNQCLKGAAIGGYVLIYAPLFETACLDVDEIHFKELVVLGSVRHDKESVREATSIIGDGLINLEDLNLEFCSFTDFDKALEKAINNRDIHRVLLTWDK
ncbi:MAG: zinc-dependent alcohol dehydrogenase [Zhaonellaceae bacterium]|jgi:2-desacetyl-2-hydroxyethyl bacteriochlorophyllide A dehydrogenase